MRISKALYDQMVAHALRDAPDECCGIVSSRDSEAVKVYEMENIAHSPLRYEMAGSEQFKVIMEIDDAELDLGVIYHSHTRSDPYPSQTDINLAFYPDTLYVIVGTASGDEPLVKAYEIKNGHVAEAVLTVVD
jgi:[CysO sulfur-carrier protein]-S-L-cysteine hydrolase